MAPKVGQARFSMWVSRAALGCLLLAGAPRGAWAQQILRSYRGGQALSFFGDVVDWLGDIDGDGFGDLIVGANGYTGQYYLGGKVYVFSGLSGSLLYSYEGSADYAGLGSGAAGLGDVDGDGVPDFGASEGSSLVPAQSFVWSGADGSLLFQMFAGGGSLAALGDLDGDGLGEVLLGGDPSFVLLGGSFAVYHVIPRPFPWIGQFGWSSAGLGDVNGDGVGDLAIGAPAWGAICNPGFVGVYSGWNGAPLYYLIGDTGDDWFGYAVDGVGDVNGDGIPDLAVGAPQDCGAPTTEALCHCGGTTGQMRVYDGSTGQMIWEVNPPQGSAYWVGSSAAGPGDVDGDGIPDVLFYLSDYQGDNRRVRLVDGATSSTIYTALNPFPPSYMFGWGKKPLRGTGDVDGDDFPDFLIGAYDSFGSGSDTVFLYSGTPIGVATFGSACPTASGSLPRIGSTGSPNIGTALDLNLSQVPPALPALLFLGISNTTWSGVPLPLDLGLVGMPGCDLLVSVEASIAAITTAVGPGQGAASATLSIPNNGALVGLSLYAQWFVANPPGAPHRGR